MRLKEQALAYQREGWVTVPLGRDRRGFLKRPLVAGWQRLRLEDVPGLPWAQARGIAILLGPPSGGLAVVDVDDEALARAVFAWLVRSHRWVRASWTPRRRLHVYVRERRPSRTERRRVRFRGREVTVDLLASGHLVAAPPTPGYVLVAPREPWEAQRVAEVWEELSRAVGAESVPGEAPRLWEATVPRGRRNDTLFGEAIRLRKAGVPLRSAVELLQVRAELAYEPGGDWDAEEIRRTVTSAYLGGKTRPWGGIPV